jgi:hypothetical protein
MAVLMRYEQLTAKIVFKSLAAKFGADVEFDLPQF